MHRVTSTWSWNHKQLIVIASLALALIIDSGIIDPVIPTLEAEATYIAPRTTLADQLEDRAYALYEANRQMDLEKYRQQAIQELGHELVALSATSTFVDYNELKEKYGY
jgi:hypothetical protein